MAASPEFEFTELFPLAHDDTPFRLVTTEGVRTVDTPLGTMLQVDPSAITRLTSEAMRDSLIPSAGRNSYIVTTGPGRISVTSPCTPRLFSFCTSLVAVAVSAARSICRVEWLSPSRISSTFGM